MVKVKTKLLHNVYLLFWFAVWGTALYGHPLSGGELFLLGGFAVCALTAALVPDMRIGAALAVAVWVFLCVREPDCLDWGIPLFLIGAYRYCAVSAQEIRGRGAYRADSRMHLQTPATVLNIVLTALVVSVSVRLFRVPPSVTVGLRFRLAESGKWIVLSLFFCMLILFGNKGQSRKNPSETKRHFQACCRSIYIYSLILYMQSWLYRVLSVQEDTLFLLPWLGYTVLLLYWNGSALQNTGRFWAQRCKGWIRKICAENVQ